MEDVRSLLSALQLPQPVPVLAECGLFVQEALAELATIRQSARQVRTCQIYRDKLLQLLQ